MNKIYAYASYNIKIKYETGVIRITNDLDLWSFFDQDIKRRTEWLVEVIQLDYQAITGCQLTIKPKSLAVEIWGHLYYEYFLLRFCKILRIDINVNKHRRLLRPAEIIDCGEKNKDSNRFVWDTIAPLYPIIRFLLPKNISSKGLKK